MLTAVQRLIRQVHVPDFTLVTQQSRDSSVRWLSVV